MYRFAFGGRGIYFGGKDVMVSELSGNFALSAEAVNADKPGALPTAKVTMQIGGGAPASFQRYLRNKSSACGGVVNP